MGVKIRYYKSKKSLLTGGCKIIFRIIVKYFTKVIFADNYFIKKQTFFIFWLSSNKREVLIKRSKKYKSGR